MKKIIMLVIILLGVELCNVNAYAPEFHYNVLREDRQFEVFDEFNSDTHKYLYGYTCTNGGSYGPIEGYLNDYIETNTVDSYLVTVNLFYYNQCTQEYVNEDLYVEIIVKDTQAPVIEGIKNYVIEYGSELPDFSKDIYYYDNYTFDNEIDFTINSYGVNTNRLGKYYVYYTAVDEFGNETTETSTVTIIDTNPPSLSTPKSITMDVNDYTFDFREGVTASDVYEGDITSRIQINYNDLDIYKLGNYQIEYIISDINGNETTALVTVDVVDREKPIIHNVKEIIVEFGANLDDIDITNNISVTDNYYDNLELKYDVSRVNTNVIGTYSIVYYTTDGSGNVATAYSNIKVVDSVAPVIEVIDDNIVINIGDSNYDFKKHFSITDNYYETPTLLIDTTNVIFNSPGKYPIIVTATDYTGNITQITMNINVDGVAENPGSTDNTQEKNNNIEIENNEYEATDLSKLIKPALILIIPVVGFIFVKSYLFKGQ